MDWAAVLERGVIDPDPASDVEREPSSYTRVVEETNKKGKKGKKTVVSKVSSSPGELSVSSIVEEMPSKKIVMEFLKMRVSEILEEME